jgi:hypothetical protein
MVLPLMVAGAAMQYAGAQDKETKIRLAMRQYLDNLKAFQARSAQRYDTLNGGLNQLQPQFGQNLTTLAKGVTDQGAITGATGAAQGEMNDAVAQTRTATAGTGAMDYAGGNQATAQLGQANAEQYADRLAKSTGAAALGQGLQAGDQAAQAASAQYGNDDESLRRKIAELFGIVDVGNAADSVGRAQNESLGQSRMRHAQGVGNDSMQYGQLMQLGGLAYGAYQPQMANYWAQLFGQARPSTDLTNGGSAGNPTPQPGVA